MGRTLPVLIVGAVLVAALLLPSADSSRLAALDAYELLAEPLGGVEGAKPMWRHVLDGPAVTRTDDGLELRLDKTLAEPTEARRATAAAGELLALPVGPEPPSGQADARPPLWRVVLDGPAAERTEAGLVLRLYGVRHAADPERMPDIEDHYALRLSLAEGLLELAASDPTYADLEIDGVHEPKIGGASFLVSLEDDVQTLVYEVDETEIVPVVVRRTWTPGPGNEAHLRRSLVRGLRELASDDEGYGELVVVGESEPAPPGASFRMQVLAGEQILHYQGPTDTSSVNVKRTWTPVDRSAIIPPLVAVALAILFRRPLVALFLGVFAGSYLVLRGEGAGLVASLGGGLTDVFREYLWTELRDWDRLQIIGFVVFMLAMVGVMTRSGGIRGLMDAVASFARGVRRTQVATWTMGLIVFFDDYANTILVGSTMRPLTDRVRISREKLSYIVDSTAAPVAGLSIFSTWIAFEVSTFNKQLPAAGLSIDDGYAIFLRTIPYSFYCILTLYFVGLVAFTGRDLGAMLGAERRARTRGELLRPGATPMVSEQATTMEPAHHVHPAAWRAVLPLLTFIGVTLLEIARVGGAFGMAAGELLSIEGATRVLFDGSGSWPLLVGSVAGFLMAAFGAFTAGLTSDVARAAWTTLRAMGVAFGILYLAWMIGAVCADLGTAAYLTGLLGDAIDPRLLPTLLFVLAGVVAFATGSSWSTMSILLPLVVGLAYNLGLDTGLGPDAVESGRMLVVICIGAVLSGAIFGDHCSPISDTTVMSSIASASDHIDHVRTQAPYAILTMAVSVGCGYLPAAWFGFSPWIGLLIGCVLLTLVLLVFGRPSGEYEEPPPATS